MSITNYHGYVCFEQAVSEEEVEAITLYWECDFNEMRFNHKVNDLNKKFAPTISNVSTLVRSKSSYSCDLQNFLCHECGRKKTIKVRSNFKLQVNQNGYICFECLDALEALVILEFKDVLANYTADIYNSKFDYRSLSYLEKVNLFLLLSEYHKRDGEPLYSDTNLFSLTGCHQTDDNFISTLVRKGALLVLDDISNELQEIINEFHGIRKKKYLLHKSSDSNIKGVDYHSEVMESYTSAGIYLCFSDYQTCDELKIRLFTDICEKNLTQSDIIELQFVVESARYNTILKIAERYAYEFNFSLEQSIKLDNVLSYLGKNYPLPIISHVLYRIAERVAARLHRNPVPTYIERKLYAKELDEHLTLCSLKEWKITYTRRLPFELQTSLFESFMCKHFFVQRLNWFDISTAEILEHWVKGCNFALPPD